jgi:predicted DCC family thiol-disulfide oxidoreductase YuxK
MNIVIFDGICNLCTSSIKLLLKFDRDKKLHFVSQQSKSGKIIMDENDILDDNKSIIFFNGQKVYYKSDAILAQNFNLLIYFTKRF